MPTDGKYLTPREAADLLRVDRETVYNRIKSGRLEAFRLAGGNRIRIPTEAVDGLLTKTNDEKEQV